MKQNKKWFSLFLCLILSLSLIGCREKTVDAPELLEPLGSKDVIHTVTRGDLATTIYKSGRVIPEKEVMTIDYDTTYYNGAATLGMKVKKGQVLFRINSELDDTILNLKADLEVKEKSYILLKKQQDEQLKGMKDQAAMFRSFGDNYNAKLVEIAMRQQEYEFSLRNKDTEEEIEKMKEQLAEYEENAKNTCIMSPCDGTVVYSLIEEEGELSEGQTFVIIAKDDVKLVSCDYMKAEIIQSYEKMQAQIGETLYDMEYIPYTEEEIYVMEEEGFYEDSVFRIADLPEAVDFGDYVGMLFTNIEEDVLTVPTESIQVTGEKCFVTVVNGDYREQREVAVGRTGLNDTIITEGLSENEKVFVAKNLESFSAKPETIKPEMSDFVWQMRATGAYRTAKSMGSLINKVPGILKEIKIPMFGERYVNAGDPLYVVEARISEVDLEQARLDHKNFKKEYDNNVTQYEERIAEQKKALKNIKNKTEKELAEIALKRLEEEFAQYKEDGTKRLEELSLRITNFEEWKDQDVTVYAEEDCVIETFSSMEVGKEEGIAEGQYICEILDPATFRFCVKDGDGNAEKCYLRYGQTVTFSSRLNGESIDLDATVLFAKSVATKDTWPIGNDWQGEAVFVFENPEDYLKANNTGTVFYERCNVKNVLMIPTQALRLDTDKHEKPFVNELDSVSSDTLLGPTSYYVWVYDKDGIAVRRNVRVAEAADNMAWICDGLSLDDVVILP